MDSQPQWKRHVGKVSATARFFCPGLTADEVTEALGVAPTETQTAHETAHFGPGGLKGAHDCTLWTYDTAPQITSTDINEHIKHLLTLFLRVRSRIEELRPVPHLSVSIYWESTIADIAGPHIDAECISGLAELGAGLEIKITKIDEVEEA